MSYNEIINLIEKTTQSIKKIRNENSIKTASDINKDILQKLLENKSISEIQKKTRELVKEAYMLGPAGNICPKCGGTGRI